MLPIRDRNPSGQVPAVSWALIAVNILVFMAYFPLGSERSVIEVYQTWGLVPARLSAGEGASTLVTAMFIHGGWLHLGLNMLFLRVFGDNIEDAMGHWRYPLFFVLCGMAGAGTEAWLTHDPYLPVIGASGAIAGVMGAYLLLHPRAKVLVLVAFRVPVLVPAGVFVGLSVVLDLISALSDIPGEVRVAFWVHVGGFAMGAALIPLLRKRDVPLFQPPVPHPEAGFLGAGRWLPDFARERPGGSALAFWLKAVLFFVLISILVETFLAGGS